MMKVLGSSSSGFVGSKSFPPGFRFHPTDEELVMYYLKRKICRRPLKLDIIAETDVYKWDPDDLPGISKLKTGDRQWFFFSPRDRKYPNGGRSNRATMHGYWKATGKDRAISCNSRTVGLKKTLVYYKGRAPSGERTDWVMHEYALDEEELKRCPSAQDYYLLYKLYKKSGPGPKNGEQYGAPFKEEEWSDDECVNFSVPVDLEKTVQEADVSLIDNDKSNTQPQCWLNDLEEFLNRIADEPVNVPPLAVDFTSTLDQLIGDEENVSTLVDHSSREVNIPDRSMVNFEQAPSQLRLYEASEVTPASNISGQRLGGDNLVVDFLEMNDLLDPAPTVQNEAPAFDEIDGLTENDLYNDAAMFLRDMGPDELGQISQPYFMNNNFEGGLVNMDSHSYLNNIENEPVNSQMQPYLVNNANSQTWTNDQRFSILTPAENQSAISSQPNSGVVCNGNAANLPTGAAQSQNVNEDNGTDSWLSSVLWTFVESIPTAPASASENCLVNRSFDRMSSFGKVTANLIKNNDATGNQAATSRRFTGSKGGIFGFSILGIFFAILWVLIDLP